MSATTLATAVYSVLALVRFVVGLDSGTFTPFVMQSFAFLLFFGAAPLAMSRGGLAWEEHRMLYCVLAAIGGFVVLVLSLAQPDFATGYVVFVLSAAAYIAALRQVTLALQRRSALGAVAGGATALVAGGVLLITSWAFLFFE